MMIIFFIGRLTNDGRLMLSLAGTIVRDPHHHESPARREQDFNLHKTWVQAQLNKVVQ